jgi:acyl carrier protein
VIARGDVSSALNAKQLFARLAEGMPPLRGIIHCAAVFDDGAVENLDWPRFERVLAPKVDGAWNLHTHTRGSDLDFFVLFSSIASIFGAPGQSNYAAANAFLDGLAHYRRALGLPALSVNWSAWTHAGAATRGNVTERLAAQGIVAFSPEEGFRALESLLASDATQASVMPVDWPKFLRQFETGSEPALLRDIAAQIRAPRGSASDIPSSVASQLSEDLAAASPARRRGLLFSHIEKQAAKVLGRDAAHAVDPERPLHEMGLDSLMAVELRNALGASLGRKLPAAVLFDYPTLNALTDYIGDEILEWKRKAPMSGHANGDRKPGTQELIGKIENLSDEEVERLFRE